MKNIITFIIFLALFSCQKKQQEQEVTPWGTVVGSQGEIVTDTATGVMALDDIIEQGEMIMLTLNGPETYYDYHGHGMGLQYLLCDKFAQTIGVKLRVEVCKDSTELVRKLKNGEGDIIAYNLNDSTLTKCGPDWMVRNESSTLAAEIKKWFKPELIAETEKMQKSLLASGGVTRHVYAPMINRQKGLISKWDNLFQKHAPTARLDWRLLAAQCYQESCFDPKAHSWAGACGLMQIMPSTAKYLGLPIDNIYQPDANIGAAARYMAMLMQDFKDIPNQTERLSFALASYNGGKNHVRDAMALASKHGKNPQLWRDVKVFILGLAKKEYYTDPVVKYGYMRGSETADYVDRIMKRWQDYGGNPNRMGGSSFNGYTGPSTQPSISGTSGPKPAKRKHKYSI